MKKGILIVVIGLSLLSFKSSQWPGKVRVNPIQYDMRLNFIHAPLVYK